MRVASSGEHSPSPSCCSTSRCQVSGPVSPANDVPDLLLLATMEHVLLAFMGVAHGTGQELVGDDHIDDVASLAHRLGELGMDSQPLVDGRARDLEEGRQLVVGPAQQAKPA